ncbi:homoserine O-acetyltransferase MetX [Paludisphaera rhizosphaerae]|uniref:homoserine O-acetyltransferase MetX n=1 Tax=Paludisphaera rhizosphaerae TaxID=2711216 RepID=UPI0013EA6DC9|nr:homoserine O-acetyltransferase [Paludisphaera rhizosphaerae]
MSQALAEIRTQFFEFDDPAAPLPLCVGPPLSRFTLAYEVYGRMNADKSNVVLLYHAMTGSQHAAGWNPDVPGTDGRWTDEMHEGWWDAFIGPGKALDTDRFCVVCANYLGGCYGSTGPASINPATDRPWGSSFPVLRMRDIVESQMKLLDYLGVDKLHAVVGPSLGGYLALLTAAIHPERVRFVLPITTGVDITIDQRILNFEQVTAIEADPNFHGGDYYDGARPDVGLALARRIAHKAFISPDALRMRARAEVVSHKPPHGWYEMNHPVESYMLHQGQKFVKRFDANSYLRILDAWQWFNLVKEADARDYVDLFRRCLGQEFLVFSIDNDHTFSRPNQEKLVRLLKMADVPVIWITVHSDKGHDAFLLEPRLFAPHIQEVLNHFEG